MPDLRRVIVPLGGGGLASGLALAVKHARPDVEVVGVQAAACAPFAAGRRDGAPPVAASTSTIADGIAVKRPGAVTRPLVERWLDDVVVDEHAVAEAMVLLLERSKLVVEGAGAVPVAALLSGAVVPAARGTTVAVLSGGNVDVGLLATLTARNETRTGRRVRLWTHVADSPGSLATLLTSVADAHVNLIAVEHLRDGVQLPVKESGVALTVEVRDRPHLDAMLESLRSQGFEIDADS